MTFLLRTSRSVDIVIPKIRMELTVIVAMSRQEQVVALSTAGWSRIHCTSGITARFRVDVQWGAGAKSFIKSTVFAAAAQLTIRRQTLLKIVTITTGTEPVAVR